MSCRTLHCKWQKWSGAEKRNLGLGWKLGRNQCTKSHYKWEGGKWFCFPKSSEQREKRWSGFSFWNYKLETSDLIHCWHSFQMFSPWASFGWQQSVCARSSIPSEEKFFLMQEISGSRSGTVCAQPPATLGIGSLNYVWASIFTLVYWVK